MTAATHTPAEWELRVNGVFLRVVTGEHKTTVADGIVSEVCAHKIVAAPDMLKALIGLNGILATAESNASGNPEWEAVSAKVNAARAAIAKATGQ